MNLKSQMFTYYCFNARKYTYFKKNVIFCSRKLNNNYFFNCIILPKFLYLIRVSHEIQSYINHLVFVEKWPPGDHMSWWSEIDF